MSYRSFGTVEGILKRTSGNPSVVFIEDALTGKCVCLGFIKPIETYGSLQLDQRCAAHGQIAANEAGEKMWIEVEKIEFFPPESELPTVKDVTGILGGAA